MSKYAARELLNAWRKRVQDGKVRPAASGIVRRDGSCVVFNVSSRDDQMNFPYMRFGDAVFRRSHRRSLLLPRLPSALEGSGWTLRSRTKQSWSLTWRPRPSFQDWRKLSRRGWGECPSFRQL